MKKVLILTLGLLWLNTLVWGANKVAVTSSHNNIEQSFDLTNQQEIAGLAVALKFANKEDDVILTSASFEGTRLEKLELKEAIVDNVEKTVLIYGIVLEEDYLAAGEGAIVKLTFAGKDVDKVNFTPTTIAQQVGITLVSPSAKVIPYDFKGESKAAGSPNLPQSFSLLPNYPNPFNASTQIRYSLPENARVKLEIFNILGQKVKVLVDESQTAGFQQVTWNGTNYKGEPVASGVYLYRIQAGQHQEVKKMSLLK